MIAAIVLTLNEERHLPNCLASLAWADRRVVFDSFSTDRTVEVGRAAGAEVIQHRFENYAQQRNAAIDTAGESEWILFVDADERIPPDLAEEIREVTANGEVTGWWVPRHNYLFGRLTLHAGWFPDYQFRLMRRGKARFVPERHVHELADMEGTAGYLANPLIHLNYETVAEFIAKQHDYARYDAGMLRAEGRRAKPHNFILQPIRQFWWRFVTHSGWRDGWHGLRLSALMAYFQWVMYRELSRPPAGK